MRMHNGNFPQWMGQNIIFSQLSYLWSLYHKKLVQVKSLIFGMVVDIGQTRNSSRENPKNFFFLYTCIPLWHFGADFAVTCYPWRVANTALLA